MTADELRADPYAWAFARQHRQMQPVLARSKRRRRGLQLFVGASLVGIVSLFGASMLSAGPPPAVGVNDGGSGGFEISVQPGAGPNEIVTELRSALEESGTEVQVETIGGRDEIVGRVIGDGPGVSMIDSDTAFDYTATRILIEPGATGVVSVVVGTDGTWDLAVADVSCSAYGRTLAEVRGELEARGFSIVVTPVITDRQNETASFLVFSVSVLGDHVSVVAQPLAELGARRSDCP